LSPQTLLEGQVLALSVVSLSRVSALVEKVYILGSIPGVSCLGASSGLFRYAPSVLDSLAASGSENVSMYVYECRSVVARRHSDSRLLSLLILVSGHRGVKIRQRDIVAPTSSDISDRLRGERPWRPRRTSGASETIWPFES
jgi:hypothetical protein